MEAYIDSKIMQRLIQLSKAIQSIPYNSYEVAILCGFSSGSNDFLGSILHYGIKCLQ